MNNIKAIVTGGAGFIGSHLVERLISHGCEVIVLDDFSNGRQENLDGVKASPLLAIHRVDITDHPKIKHYFDGVKWVFHLAALADIVPSIQQPLKYHKANVDGAISVLEAARHAGAEKFLYAASSSCYGIPDKFPTPETAPIRPMYPYALTKYIGEEMLLHWSKVYSLPVISLRLFNVYGPRSRTSGTYGAVFGVFLAQRLAGKPLTIVGDGRQKRDFIYVSDVADAFLAAARSNIKNEIFNVGSGKPQDVNTLASILGGATTHIPKRPGEPDCTWADIGKITSMIGWRPRISFEEGVKKVVDRIDYWKNAPVWTPEMIEETTKDWFKYLTKG